MIHLYFSRPLDDPGTTRGTTYWKDPLLLDGKMFQRKQLPSHKEWYIYTLLITAAPHVWYQMLAMELGFHLPEMIHSCPT
jgi:hypothetical protein